MPGKHLTIVVRHFANEQRRRIAAHENAVVLALLFTSIFLPTVFAEGTNSIVAPKFLGAQSCSSSGCHGGAGEKNNQYTIWSTHDFHHARPYATLETARSERLAEVLKIGNPTQSARCTVCHAPFQTVPAERLGHNVAITEGISCESCHGPAENWIRSHTRLDYTHADRVAAGMRDLKNLYVRANTCVACHQNIDPEIRAAGHPELIFEMDGQSVTMPRHWARANDFPGPQIWFVGQAVALREISWQLNNIKTPTGDQTNRWYGIVWWMQIQPGIESRLEPDDYDFLAVGPKRFERTSDWANRLAQDAANLSWSEALTRKLVSSFSSNAAAFTSSDSPRIHARRAERLVLALDRFVAALPEVSTNSTVNQSLNKLFADAQSLPDFDPKQFAEDLNTFHSSVAGFLETK